MAFLSQYSGSSDVGRLKLKAGPYLEDVANPNSGEHIRDFTAQNDHLMISTHGGSVFVGKRINELLQCNPVDNTTFTAASYQLVIGGDPFPTQLNRYTTAIGYYANTTTDRARLGIYGSESKTLYLPQGATFTVSTTGNSTSVANSFVKRFVYSGDDLFYIGWSAPSDRLYIYAVNNTTGAWEAASYTYAGSQSLAATGSLAGNPTGVNACTYPELDPVTGDIVMFMNIGTEGYKLVYDHSANSWQFFDVVTDLEDMNTSYPSTLSMDGNSMIITTSYASTGTYLYSTDGGDNWTTNNVGTSDNYYFKESGVANGTFYTVNCVGSNNQTYPGVLMSSTNLINWSFVDTPEVPDVQFIRNNGSATACYISTGHFAANSNSVYLRHGMKRLT